MESVAHSRQPNKVSVTHSKKITNGGSTGGFSAKTLYDDVYGGPPKFAAAATATTLSPRFEDYSEIFASFQAVRASSIPVLDLPAVDGGEVFVDFRSSAFDYAEVFGGSDGLDFCVSYEELFRDGVSEEEEEAWTPVETDSFSGDFDHFGNNQGISSGDIFQSVDGSTEFNLLYHKVGKTHITQLHTVPGFTHVVDETTRFHRTDPSLQVVDDIDLDMEFNASKAKRNYPRKMVSHPCNFTSGEQILGSSDLNLHDGCNKIGSHSSETFITVSDISLRTLPSQVPPPSRLPPLLDANKGYTSGFHSNNERVDCEETLGDSSPPFYDVEVDMNSSAAVMKVAMHRPEPKLMSAKEMKERKKGDFESNVKSSYDVKNKGPKMSENITRFNSLNGERIQATCDPGSGKMRISATDEKRKARKAVPETPEPLEGERLLNMFEEKHIKESRSSQESNRSAGFGTWKEATEFLELVGTEESGKLIQPINHAKSLVQDNRKYDRGRKEREASNIQEEYKKVKAIAESNQLEEYKKKSKAVKEAFEQGKNIRRSKSSNEECRQREYVKNDEMTEIFELEKSEKKARMVHQHGKTEKKVTKAGQSGSLKDVSEIQCKELKNVEIEKSKEVEKQTLSDVQWSMKLKENEKKLKEDEEQWLNVKRHRRSQKMKENGKIQKAEGEEKVKDSVKLEKIDERSNEAFKLDSPEEIAACKRESEFILKQEKQLQNKKGLKEACETKEIEKSLNGSIKKEESDEGLKHALGLVENENGVKEDFESEMSEKRTREAFELRKFEVCERGQGEEKFREVCDGYGKGYKLKEVGDSRGIRKVLKQAPELERNTGNEAQRKKEIESPSNQTFDREGSVDISDDYSHFEQSEKVLKDAVRNEKDKGLDKSLERMEGNGERINMKFVEETKETWKPVSDENLLAAHSSSIHVKNIEEQEASQEPIADQEIGKTGADCNVGEKKLEEVGAENVLANGNKRDSEMPPGIAESSGTQSGKVDYSMTYTDELGFSSEQTCTKKTKTVPEMKFDPKRQEGRITHEWSERGRIKQQWNVALNNEESREQMSSSEVNTCGDYRGNTVADELATMQEASNVQKTSQRPHLAHSTKSKEKNLNETPSSVEKDAERMRRERELEKDRLRKLEEEMEREKERQKDRMAVDRAMLETEREREREKDRMAVERATFEARDRVYAEARERAERAAFERATAEARQRALADARERLEKACAEARDKSYSDKAAAEARLKAERAAVERATAEARERAMEKVKVERAAFESRERLERSVSEKFGVSFRNDGRQGSSSSDMLDPHFQSISSSTGSHYPYSSVYGASSFSERSEREGESAQRCRARLERHRRTAERAAKALEEKNVRDLLAQKEQAERNRLAETLDAEVRRWSSGKEGNLRALLSTLQYILGPDSGWQPIPLTEVITSAAVKKAYRKATLCVHPDKLQQRGASIQHKYICEKVFDLLKEAWNKFNSEER
ncbi:auxilin-like protein 1 [Gastrolobium bilobum]|uniref:auxilin-like protein 1 n=1 Tax=Gastrolobium bilobum TaxID=150636 RepID=UPI002AB01F0A|nr:auxilin-like protein 1 [Gastrolobium bilobum]